MKQRLADIASWVDAHVSQASGRSAKWADLDPRRHESGFLGSVPYVLILRYLIAFAVPMRFYVHRSEYTTLEMWIRLSVVALIALMAVAATVVAFKPVLRNSLRLQALFILADFIVISVAYGLTGAYGSDFFLFYYLPIFSAVEYFGIKGATAISIGVGLGMILAVLFMHAVPDVPSAQWLPVLRVLLPRWIFLLAVALSSAFVFSGLSRRQGELFTLLDGLHRSADVVPDVQELDQILESILSELTEKLKFEFATISLVDEYRNCIETVRGRNISPGWIMRARHQLNVRDIQTHVVNTAKAVIIVGWDDRLDKDIYHRFEHSRLARIWAPIVTSDHCVVGTIEAGCDKERRDEVFTQSAVEKVEHLGYEHGNRIAATRPHILLRGIAGDAIQLIGADSATLHVYRQDSPRSSQADGDNWGELILAAGAGKATSEFVQSIQPRPRGRGRRAIETGQPVWLDDPVKFKSEYSTLYDRGVRALAVIPLKLGTDTQGLLGIHFWRNGKRFTNRELDLATMFGSAMEGVIQNYLLLRRATEAGSRAWALSGLQNLMQSLTSPFSLSSVLSEIARTALLALDADNVVLYQFHADSKSFSVPPVTNGQFLDPASMKLDLSPDDTPFEFVKLQSSRFIVDVRNYQELDLATPRKSEQSRFVDREQLRSCAVLILKPNELDEVVGILYVNFRKLHNFREEEKRAMDALATSAALAIRNARLHRGDLKKQLQAMHEVHAAIAEKGPDLKQGLEPLVQQTVSMTGAKYGVCMRWNEHTGVLQPVARWPVRDDYPSEFQTIDEGIMGLAARSRRSIFVEDVLDDTKSIFVETIGDIWPATIYKAVNSDTRCEIAVPLLDGGALLGVLNIEHPEPRGLTQDDRVLLQTLSVPAIIAFHTVDLYKRLERRIRHLTTLNLIAARVQGSPYDLDTIFRLFLTGITAGAGLGFSRAMLFLVDQEGKTLRGNSAIGPVSEQQATTVWENFERGGSSSADSVDPLLQQAEQFTEGIKDGKLCEYSPLSKAIRDVAFPIDGSAGAAAECLLQCKIVKIKQNQDDPFREVLADITQPNNVQHAFAAVPLLGKHSGRIGVLIVDNRFLWKESAIDAEDLEGLEAFAGLLALSIDNIRLQQRLTEENWKEITGSIAHSLETRISVIAGKVSRLRSTLTATQLGDTAGEVGALLDRLTDGVDKASQVVGDFLSFATPNPLRLESVDLRRVIRDVSEEVEGTYRVEISSPVDPLPTLVDVLQMGNALMELIKNSYQAALGVDRLPLVIMTVSSENSADGSTALARVDIRDNGPGIPENLRSHIFEPFFTTKDGTGLGLAIAKSVVQRHKGTIELLDGNGMGAWFAIRIPMLAVPTGVALGGPND